MPHCERHSFVWLDELHTVKTNRGQKDAECRGGVWSITAIHDGMTRPDENVIATVHSDVVANRAFDVAAVDGAKHRRLARIFGDERDRDGSLWPYGEDLRGRCGRKQ